MAMQAVLTGDAVGSSKTNPDNFRSFQRALKDTARRFAEDHDDNLELGIETFQGDSFQVVMNSAALALEAVLFFRAMSLMRFNLDIRIAIGIGSPSESTSSKLQLRTQNGEAFRRSGRAAKLFSAPKNHNQKLIVDAGLNITTYLRSPCLVLDCAIAGWGRTRSAAPVYWTLRGKTQTDISTILKINQPAVSFRLQNARWDFIRRALRNWKDITNIQWPEEEREGE
jgi:hypothetical protein